MGEKVDETKAIQPATVDTVSGPIVMKEVTLDDLDLEDLWSKGCFVEAVDLLSEQQRLHELYKHPLDRLDASRMVLYMQNLAMVTPNPEERLALSEVTYKLALTHGDVISAMHIALAIHDNERVYELFELCQHWSNKPADLMATAEENNSWPEAARISYNISAEDTEKVAQEQQLRKLLQIQLAYVASGHKLGFDESRILAAAPVSTKLTNKSPVAMIEDVITTEDKTDDVEMTESYTADLMEEHKELRVDAVPSLDETDEHREALSRILRREYISDLYQYLAAELEVVEPRSPDDIFKTTSSEGDTSRHQQQQRMRNATCLDSTKLQLSSAYASAFVHCGFGKDQLILNDSDTSCAFINKMRQHGVTAATASIGLITLWNVEAGLTAIDKYQYSPEMNTRSGALLAFGINTCNVANEFDPVLDIIKSDALKSDNPLERLAAYTALGYAYCGTARSEIAELLVPVLIDLSTPGGLECSGAAALALGMTFVGTADENIADALIQTMIERCDTPGAFDSIHAVNFSIAIALIYLETKERCQIMLDSLAAVIVHPIGEFTSLLVEGSAHVGTGNVTKVEKMINACISGTEQADKDDTEGAGDESQDAKDNVSTVAQASEESPSSDGQVTVSSSQQVPRAAVAGAAPNPNLSDMAKQLRDHFLTAIPASAVLAIALITMRDDTSVEMVFRWLNHVLQFDALYARRAIPIALALLSVSNPKPAVVDLLTKLSHDLDGNTQLHAVLALGVVGAGTNNARVAHVLRGLSAYFADLNALFLVRMSQGLLYSGKGLVSMSPLHADRTLINQSSMAGLLSFCVQALFTEHTVCQGRYHLNYYHLTPAIHPRWLITVDENLKPVAVQVRVGQAVDVAGMAGQPKRITGFRTHNTPVLLAYDERAQIGSAEWHPLSPVFEGVVVVKKLTGKDKLLAGKALE